MYIAFLMFTVIASNYFDYYNNIELVQRMYLHMYMCTKGPF